MVVPARAEHLISTTGAFGFFFVGQPAILAAGAFVYGCVNLVLVSAGVFVEVRFNPSSWPQELMSCVSRCFSTPSS